MRKNEKGKLILIVMLVIIVLIVVLGIVLIFMNRKTQRISIPEDIVKYNPYGTPTSNQVENLTKEIDTQAARERSTNGAGENKRLEEAAGMGKKQ